MKITVVTPNYNHSQFLEQSIRSVLDQTQKPDEYFIIDDASTDHSSKIIKKFEHIPFVRIVCRKKNRGGPFNIQEGLKKSSGDFILFLSSDDFLEPTLIEEYKKFLLDHPSVGLCCSKTNKLMEGQNCAAENKISRSIPEGFIEPQQAHDLIFKYGSFFSGNTILLNRRKALAMGGFNPNILSYTDGFLYMALSVRYGLIYVNKVLSTYRRHEQAYSMDTYRNIDKLEKIEKEVVEIMNQSNDLFDKKFIKRWKKRWKCIKYNALIMNQKNVHLLLKILGASLIYVLYRWFDMFNLRIMDIKAFLRECKKTKSLRSGNIK